MNVVKNMNFKSTKMSNRIHYPLQYIIHYSTLSITVHYPLQFTVNVEFNGHEYLITLFQGSEISGFTVVDINPTQQLSPNKSLGISPVPGFQFWPKVGSMGLNGTQLQ
jgi:hypothetical protein